MTTEQKLACIAATGALALRYRFWTDYGSGAFSNLAKEDHACIVTLCAFLKEHGCECTPPDLTATVVWPKQK